MSGFGTQKEENKTSSKKLLKLSEKELKSQSINNHLKGNLREAEIGYITFIKNGYSDADVLSNYGLLCQEKGDIKKAIKLYERCTSIYPNHVFSKLNLGFLYYKIDNFDKAELTINDAIKLKPELPNGYCIKGLILKSLNKYDESNSSLKKAIEIDSKYIDAYINLGLLNKDLYNYKDAEDYYLQAIAIDKNSSIANLNLGALYKEMQEIEKAIFHTEISIKTDSQISNAYLNLATIYNEKGNYGQSFFFVKKELSINPQSKLSYQLLSELIKRSEIVDLSTKENRKILSNILNRKDISHRELFKIINKLISRNILEELSIIDYDLIKSKGFNILIKDSEIVKALTLLIFCSPLWESALRNIRKNILMSYIDSEKANKNILKFLIALGSQCFLNEYVYYTSQKEIDKLNELKKILHNNKNLEYKIALISCYEPLYSNKSEIDFLKNYKSKNDDLNELIDLQIREIVIENNISNKIVKLGNISNSISMEVKNQYELNPYPRWRYNSFIKGNNINIFSVINSEINPNRIKSKGISLTEKKLQVLIAGCGTGIQILEASRYFNCEITAIDLSSSSISYAKRKVEEYGMENVHFKEMDLLELNQLNKKFDLIECSGVLHHMQDPDKGLLNLIESLNNKGFMKLGLYSKYAREKILIAKELIKTKGIKPTIHEIRKFRFDVLNGELTNLNEITDWSDFYSTSMCRDLCFHSQEKCFSLPEIKKLLDKFNLEFLGFTLHKDIKDKYMSQNKNIESINDLDLWNNFEKANQKSFREMYQFWTRKSIK